MENYLLPRIGTFLIVIGVGFLILFIGSVFSSDFQLSFFLFAGMAFFLGTLLRKRAPRRQSGRFGGINRLRGRKQNSNEDEDN
jgi:membrane protein implicated in regulation of membrane protease activity